MQLLTASFIVDFQTTGPENLIKEIKGTALTGGNKGETVAKDIWKRRGEDIQTGKDLSKEPLGHASNEPHTFRTWEGMGRPWTKELRKHRRPDLMI